MASRLTRRQLEVLRFRARGFTVKETAHYLCIAPATARNAITAAYARLGVNSETEAFLALGWLRPPEE